MRDKTTELARVSMRSQRRREEKAVGKLISFTLQCTLTHRKFCVVCLTDHAIVPPKELGFVRGGMKESQEKTTVCPLGFRCLCRSMKGERGKGSYFQIVSPPFSPMFNVHGETTAVGCIFVFFS